MDAKEKYPVHYAKCLEIKDCINALTIKIEELGQLEKTGEPNIDNLCLALSLRHKKTIEVFVKDDGEEMHAG